MGQKVHPTGFRLGVVKGWQSRWYAERDYKDILAEDFEIRKIINKELANASVSRVEIERTAADQVQIKIYTAKPGIVIGRSGEKVERLKSLLERKTKKRRVRIEIIEIRQPELDAYLVGRNIAEQLEKRVSFRRAMKQAVQKSMRANAKGIKVIVGGRLGGAEIARSEKEVEGSVPLHTLRADIDYGQTEAHTTFGVIGVKVWIYRGDVLPSKRREGLSSLAEPLGQPVTSPREDRRGDHRRGGERGPRPQGERRPTRRGERTPRQPGERGPRPQGERTPRPQGERGPRPQGERTPRPPRAERPARPQRPAPSEQAPESTTTNTPAQNTPPASTTNTPAQNTPPASPAPESGATQSE